MKFLNFNPNRTLEPSALSNGRLNQIRQRPSLQQRTRPSCKLTGAFWLSWMQLSVDNPLVTNLSVPIGAHGYQPLPVEWPHPVSKRLRDRASSWLFRSP